MCSSLGDMASRRSLGSWLRVALLGGAAVLASCHGDDFDRLASDECRFEPERCDGGAGALCDNNGDCADPLFCCDDGNCGGGMCTADCRDDFDCPGGMRCQHDMCFYACDSDRDCAPEMSCEHGKTVCEYD